MPQFVPETEIQLKLPYRIINIVNNCLVAPVIIIRVKQVLPGFEIVGQLIFGIAHLSFPGF